MATYQDKNGIRSVNGFSICPSFNTTYTNSQTGANAVNAISFVGVANNSADDVMTITNASLAQASTLTIPDPGQSTAKFMLTLNGNAVTKDGQVTVTLSAAQVTGAYTTPVQLIAAPGTGNSIVVSKAIIYTNSTGQTAFANGGAAIVQYGNTAHGAGTDALSGTIGSGNITASSSQVIQLFGSTSALTGITNEGLYFSNATGAFTAGTGSTVVITLNYSVITATV